MRTLEEKAAKLAESIARQVEKSAGKGLAKAIKFAEARVKEAAYVKAPTKTSKSGRVYATTKAIPGAPLRHVTGRFWESITSYMVDETTGIVGSNAHAPLTGAALFASQLSGEDIKGFGYPEYWEVKNPVHQTFTPTFKKWIKELGIIVGGDIKIDLGAH